MAILSPVKYKKRYLILSSVLAMLLNIAYAIVYPLRGYTTDLEFALVSAILPLFSIVCLCLLFISFSIKKVTVFALIFFLTYFLVTVLLSNIGIIDLSYEIFPMFFIVIILSVIYFSIVLYDLAFPSK